MAPCRSARSRVNRIAVTASRGFITTARSCGRQLLVDELVQRHRERDRQRETRADVKLVEKEREHARAGLPGRPLLVARSFDRRRFRFARERPEFNCLKRLRDAVLEKLEIRRLKIENRSPLAVGHDRVDADSTGIVVRPGWLLLPGERGQPAQRKQVGREKDAPRRRRMRKSRATSQCSARDRVMKSRQDL